METQGLVDHRNTDLWNTLNKEFEISIVKEKRETYSVFTQNGKAVIYIPLDQTDCASFSHELLHIYMKKKGVFIGGGLKMSVMGSDALLKFMSEDLIEHIGNSLEHIKMLPDFLKMGFDKKDFISDYSVNKLTDKDLKYLERHFKSSSLFGPGAYNAKVVDFYVGKYFAVKACPNASYDYNARLPELMRLDKDLYSVLERFMDNWNKFDYNNVDPIAGGYHGILFDFVNELTEWAKEKRIV